MPSAQSEPADGAGARGARLRQSVNYWPGFVDALSTMLLVIIFLLSVFMLAQFFLAREVTGKDTALAKLNQQIEELTSAARARALAARPRTRRRSPRLSATLEAAQQDKAPDAGSSTPTRRAPRTPSGRAPAAANALDGAAAALGQGAGPGRHSQPADRRAAPPARRRSSRRCDASEKSDKEAQAQDRRSRLAPQCRPGAEGAGTRALPLRLLRPPAPDPRRPAGRQRRRRPFRLPVGSAVRIGQADLDPAGRSRTRQAGQRPDRTRTRDPARHSLDRCASTAIPTRSRSSRRNFQSNWDLSAARAIAVVQYLISQGRRAATPRRRRLWRIPADRPRRQRRSRSAATAASN